MSETLTPKLDPRRSAVRAPRRGRRRGLRLGAVVAVAAAIGVVVWLTLGGGGSGGNQQAASAGDGTPVPITVGGLHTLAAAVPSLIFWLGPMDGISYELTHTASNRVFVRYLPKGVAIGADKPYLTVATYPLADAYAATQRASRQPGAVAVPVGAGAVAFYNRSRPQSVFFAREGAAYQVEVYDPSAVWARKLVGAGLVKPVIEKTAGGAAEVTASGLRTFASTLGHPLYWLGEKQGYRMELTQTSNGKTFVRYLPRRVAIGASAPYLTVATYPFPGALAALKRVSSTSTRIPLAGGGLAVVDASYPKSIHLAFPGEPYQVEVFDPSPAEARAVVSGGEVQAVR